MDILGHAFAKKYLERFAQQVQAGAARHHAFVFVGPAHVGKQIVARAVARALILSSHIAWSDDALLQRVCPVAPGPMRTPCAWRVSGSTCAASP